MKTIILILLSVLISLTGCVKDKPQPGKKQDVKKSDHSWSNVKTEPGSNIDYLQVKKSNC